MRRDAREVAQPGRVVGGIEAQGGQAREMDVGVAAVEAGRQRAGVARQGKGALVAAGHDVPEVMLPERRRAPGTLGLGCKET